MFDHVNAGSGCRLCVDMYDCIVLVYTSKVDSEVSRLHIECNLCAGSHRLSYCCFSAAVRVHLYRVTLCHCYIPVTSASSCFEYVPRCTFVITRAHCGESCMIDVFACLCFACPVPIALVARFGKMPMRPS